MVFRYIRSGVIAICLKWHMCPCHEPLVAQNHCSNTFGRVESMYLFSEFEIDTMCYMIFAMANNNIESSFFDLKIPQTS